MTDDPLEQLEQWFENQMLEAKKDPRFHVEYALMDVTERICKMYGQPRGIYKILFYLLNWSANKLIWRDKWINKKEKK